MDWLIAIILVLGILTLFGWKGIEIIGRLLGLIGALFILLIAWIGLRLIFGQDFVTFLITYGAIIFIAAFIYGILQAEQEMKEDKEEKEKIKERVFREAREKLKNK